jgi:hypothetical protein
MFEQIQNIVSFGIGLAIFGLAVAQTVFILHRRQTWIVSTGIVVGFRKVRNDKRGGHFYFLRIEFLVVDRKIVFTASSGSGNRGFNVGDSVPIHYDPAKPESADLATVGSVWLVPIALGVLSLPFILGSGFRLFVGLQRS